MNLYPGQYADIEEEDAKELAYFGQVEIEGKALNEYTKDTSSKRASKPSNIASNAKDLPKSKRKRRGRATNNNAKKRHKKSRSRNKKKVN